MEKHLKLAREFLPTKRLKAFKDEETAYRMGRWLGQFAGVALDKHEAERLDIPLFTKGQTEGTNTGGGVLVPVEMMKAIISLRETYGVYRKYARVVPMANDTLMLPRWVSGPTVGNTAEAATISTSSVSYDNVQLVAKKMSILVQSSTELVEDAAIDLAEFMADEFAYAFAKQEDLAGFTGDGTSTYNGIYGLTQILNDSSHTAGNVAAASGHKTWATLTFNDITSLMGTLPGYAFEDAAFYMSPAAFGLCICRLAGGQGGYLESNRDANGNIIPTLLGYQIFLTPAMPTTSSSLAGKIMLLFGCLRMTGVLGSGRDVALDLSTNRYFDTDQVAWRGTERIDIVNYQTGDNTNAGAMVGLQGTN